MTDKRQANRREFLSGKAAVDAMADLVQTSLDAGTSDEADSPIMAASWPYTIKVGRKAMACLFEVFFNAGEDQSCVPVAIEALDLVERLEDQLTVYRPGGEVMEINRLAADGPVVIEPRLFDLFAEAIELFAETDRAFDITAGPLVKAWGFYRRQGSVPSDEAIAEALQRVSSQHLELDRDEATIRFRRAGVEINLGAIGKGYALDRMAELLTEAGLQNFLVHGGQSSVLARGTKAVGPDVPTGWPIAVRDPLRPSRLLAEIRLRDRALGTSGAGTQFFRHEGRRYGHILDPRTGRPAEGMYSATAVAPTAARADALATAFYILGVEKALDYCHAHPEIGTVLVSPARTEGEIDVHTAGLAPDELSISAPIRN